MNASNHITLTNQLVHVFHANPKAVEIVQKASVLSVTVTSSLFKKPQHVNPVEKAAVGVKNQTVAYIVT